MRLTDKTIPTATDRDLTIFDEDMPGFGLRIRPSGSRSWIAQYAVNGRTRRITLGNPPTVTAGAARSAAQKILSAARTGSDPAAEKAEARKQAASTIGALVPAFLAHAEKLLRAKTLGENTRHLMRYAKPLHGHPVATVERRRIVELLDTITAERGPVASNKTRSALSSFFVWAAQKAYSETNPVALIGKAIENGARVRALTDAELAAVWTAVGEIDGDYRDIVRLLILLGLRRSEVSDLRWSEIDLETATITVPKERTKTGEEHVVPVPVQAMAILRARMRTVGRDLVFGAGERKGFDAFSANKRTLDAKLGNAFAPWILHDLRRTLSTHLHEAPFSVEPRFVEAILGHAVPGVSGIYNKAQYLPERRAALTAWGEHIDRLTGESVTVTDSGLRLAA